MKLGTFEYKENQFVGVIKDNLIYPVKDLLRGNSDYEGLSDMLSIIEGGKAVLELIESSLKEKNKDVNAISISRAKMLSPIPRPKKNVFCVGRNYIEHVKEGDRANKVNIGAPKKPIFFTKTPTSVIGHEEDIMYPSCTQKLDYECELAVIIGKKCKDVKKDEVLDCIFGYTILNDVTARDLQDEHSQWFRGKTLDTFCPVGPYIVTKNEINWPLNLSMDLSVSGEQRQVMNTQDMIFDVPTIIEQLSSGMTLEPGDIIATGTGPGCGFGFDPPKFLQRGDVVEINIEGIGTLRNKVVG